MASAKNFANIQQWQTTMGLEYANIDGVKNPPYGFTEWEEAKDAVIVLQWPNSSRRVSEVGLGHNFRDFLAKKRGQNIARNVKLHRMVKTEVRSRKNVIKC